MSEPGAAELGEASERLSQYIPALIRATLVAARANI